MTWQPQQDPFTAPTWAPPAEHEQSYGAQQPHARPYVAQQPFAEPYAQQTHAQQYPAAPQPYGAQPAGSPYASHPLATPTAGLAPAPWSRPAYAPPIEHHAWSRTLLVVTWLGIVMTALGMVLAFVALDVFTGEEVPPEASGFVLAVTVVVSLLGLAVLGVLVWLTVSGRRRADQGDPGRLRAAAVMAIVLGGLVGLGALTSLAGGQPPSGLVGAALYLVPGIRLLQVTRA